MNRVSAFGLGLTTVAILAYGAIAGDDQRARICTPGYSQSIRPPEHVTEAMKKAMLIIKGMPNISPRAYEFDHIVPLCLDGKPVDLSNLQLEEWPEAREKDKLEVAVCRSYCAGKVDLPEAQEFFSSGKWREALKLGEMPW